MSIQIKNFAFISSLYETGSDFVQIFSYFVIQILESRPLSILEIQKETEARFGFEMPVDLLRTLIKRLRRNSCVSYDNLDLAVSLTEIGLRKKDEIQEEEKKSVRELNYLINEISQFLQKEKKIHISDDEVKFELFQFFEKYIEATDLSSELVQHSTSKFGKDIADFVILAETSLPQAYKAISNLTVGVLISSALRYKPDEIDVRFDNLSVYFDSNLILSLIELHHPAINQSVKELDLLIQKNSKLKKKVFYDTITEVYNLLYAYQVEESFYPSHMEIDSVFGYLKQKGKTRQDALVIANGLEDKLVSLGFEIDYETEVDINSNDAIAIYDALKTYKSNSSPRAIEHDTKVILGINKLRGRRPSRLIERCRYILLTLDSGLWAYGRNKYREENNFPEVVSAEYLTSILWLKNPQIQKLLPINNLVAGYVTQELIPDNLWREYLRELAKHRHEGEFTDDDVQYLISIKETEGILKSVVLGENKKSEMVPLSKKIIERSKKERKEIEDERDKYTKKYQQKTKELSTFKSSFPVYVRSEVVSAENSLIKHFANREALAKVRLFEKIIAIFLFTISSYFIWAFGVDNVVNYFSLGGIYLAIICYFAGIKFDWSLVVQMRNAVVLKYSKKYEKDYVALTKRSYSKLPSGINFYEIDSSISEIEDVASR